MSLAAAFLTALLVLSLVSWKMNDRTAAEFYRFEKAVQKVEVLHAIKEHVEQGAGDLLAFVAGRQDAGDSLGKNLDEMRARIAEATVIFQNDPSAQEELASIGKLVEKFSAHVDKLAEQTQAERQVSVWSGPLLFVAAIRERVNTMQEEASADFGAITQKAYGGIDDARLHLLGANAFVVASAIGLALLFGQLLSAPVRHAAGAARKLESEDYESQIEGLERRDEIGAIAQGLEGLRNKLRDAKEMELQQKTDNNRRVDLFQTLGIAMSRLRGGKLDARIDAEEWRDLGEGYLQLCRDFNDLAGALDTLVSSLHMSAATVQTNAGELSGMSDEMSRRAEIQAATLEQSAAALDALSGGVKSAADKAQVADEKVIEGRRRAEQGGEVMARALQAMSSIAKSSEQISKIITVIDDIAFQTNLLALNAGVEAARAGESGKGFSVVASEVRGLAQRASASAGEIKELVLNSVDQVEDGERLVQETSQTLSHIVESVSEVSGLVSAIARMAREQAGGVQEINVGIAELDKVTQHNAAMVNQTSASSQQLTVEATRLSNLLAQFTGGTEVAAPTSVAAGVPELFGMDFAVETPPHDGASDLTKETDGGFDHTSADPDMSPAENTQGGVLNDRKSLGEYTTETAGDDGVRYGEQNERLLHGSWDGEAVDPRPVEVEEEKLAINAPAASRFTAAKGSTSAPAAPVTWDEF
ncbi:probable methyl accepting chemotaxis transmembrane protein [Sagittula stellata E-37]|uniref:Probable methyl accepting chemotaxis transmembrane protein n=2 Tax=Sagittula stellata TaxID=52603 RepID=A3JXB9_SAGS3|nr:probable methyl accepting chemotaxis transmembrane protein [Sagittula stellata E-37]